MLMVALLATCTVRAQVAKWVIPPRYDAISRAEGTGLIIADSLDEKIVFSQEGKRLAETTDMLCPFAEDVAVTVKRGTTAITGFYDKNGGFTGLPSLSVACGYPYFSDGLLLVQQDRFFAYVDKAGKAGRERYIRAFPCFNGYASCSTYQNMEKEKDPYNLLLTSKQEKVRFSYGDKAFDADDIDFVSSVNDEGIGIVVARHKVYFFHGDNQSLTPVFATEGETNMKNQAKLEDDLSVSLARETDTTSVLRAKCGKAAYVRVRLDAFMRPVSFLTAKGERLYKEKAVEKEQTSSPLGMTEKGGKYGVTYGGQEVLPPQLDELLACFGDKAFVKSAGKYGMLEVLRDDHFKITINKGLPIDFRHQKYETMIRLDLPREISAHHTRIEVDPDSGCDVDMTSGEKRDTEFGNYIQYNCVLNIPESLPDEMYEDERNEIVYPTQVIYDGLKSPVIPYKVRAWHYKYFNVDVIDGETSYGQGNVSFTFNINAERNPGEAVYPIKVNILADTLNVEQEKISETRYKCKVYGLVEGVNNIVVQILEQGCPPASFPFEVFYTKPSARKKNKPAVKEKVEIRKKTRKTSTPAPAPVPHLEI